MSLWSREAAVAYFESGGEIEPPPPIKAFTAPFTKGTKPTGDTPWLSCLEKKPDATKRLVVFSWTGNRGGQGSAHNLRRAPLNWSQAAGAWWLPTGADAEAAPAPKKGDGNAWRAEWREMRRDQLDLQEQSELAGADERTTAGRPDSLEWAIRSFSPQINAMVREEWPRGLAEAYTLISCCGAAALARARRDGSEKYKNSESLVVGVLHERAAQMTAAAPRCFAHLSGMLGLAEADPAWRALFSAKPNAAGAAASSASGGGDYGVEPFTTSALVIAIDSPRCLPEAGTTPYHAHLSRGGVKECAAPSSRSRSLPNTAHPARPSPRASPFAGGPPSTPTSSPSSRPSSTAPARAARSSTWAGWGTTSRPARRSPSSPSKTSSRPTAKP